MIIPIPAQHQKFSIDLSLHAQRAVTFGIWVFDPQRPNTHYFRRAVSFKGKGSRTLKIPLPISPKRLVLEIYDKKETLGHRRQKEPFKITDFSIEIMPDKKIWASPDRHKFMDFAIDFAEKAGYLSAGFYPSKDNQFLIQYLPVITDDFGDEQVTPARIHREMPRVQLSQKLIRKMSIPVRVAILSHEGCHFFRDTRSEKEADLCGIQYYLDYGFPKIEAVYAATKVFAMRPADIGQVHVQRTKDIIAFIDQYKQQEIA